MYQRVGQAAFKKDLTNINALLKQLDNPHENLRCVHVAGTNGKGSTSHYISSILQEAGLKAALYTSPHLKDFRERIRVNSEMIAEHDVLHFVNSNMTAIESIQPSFFEITVAMAFWYFDQSDVDYAIIETGLGGRLDSTNVITPLLSVITNISLDHTHMLGNALKEIAGEKAGIIKSNVPVVIGEHQPETDQIFIDCSNERSCPIYFAEDIDMSRIEYIGNGLLGGYQHKNERTALAAVHVLNSREQLEITTGQVKLGIQNVVKNTGIRGRWDIIQQQPLTIADIAHNVAGLQAVFEEIDKIEFKQLHVVLGVVNDKDINKILSLFPKDALYYFCRPDVPRGLAVELLQKEAAVFKLNGACYDSVNLACQDALRNAKDHDLIYIGGSTFVVAEAI